MALKYVGKLITDTQVFANSEGITTTTVQVLKKSALAQTKDDGERVRYIIPAGTPVPANDATAVGIVFENWDVTDDGGLIPVALSGTINEVNAQALGITYTDDCKTALSHFVFLPTNISAAQTLSLKAVAETSLATYSAATGLSYKLTLAGDKFLDEAQDSINWVIGLPLGFSVDSITKTSDTEYSIVAKALNEDIVVPSDAKVTFSVMGHALEKGCAPAMAITDVATV